MVENPLPPPSFAPGGDLIVFANTPFLSEDIVSRHADIDTMAMTEGGYWEGRVMTFPKYIQYNR